MRNRDFYRDDYKQFSENRHKNRVLFGIALAVTGLILMLTTMHLLPCFDLETSWPGILIILGILIGFKNGFRNNAWWILILVGIANFTPQFMIMGRPSRDYAWPAIIMVAGIAIALRPRRQISCKKSATLDSTIHNESNVNIDVTFGGKKEVITSKDFKGGAVSVTFAGCEINLTQADITDNAAVLDCRVSFGGVEIIVPSHWEIKNEINPAFGSVDDERTIQTTTNHENKKVLILRGSCSFGSIEIKSF